MLPNVPAMFEAHSVCRWPAQCSDTPGRAPGSDWLLPFEMGMANGGDFRKLPVADFASGNRLT